MSGRSVIGTSGPINLNQSDPILPTSIRFLHPCDPSTRLNPPNSVFNGLDCTVWIEYGYFVHPYRPHSKPWYKFLWTPSSKCICCFVTNEEYLFISCLPLKFEMNELKSFKHLLNSKQLQRKCLLLDCVILQTLKKFVDR